MAERSGECMLLLRVPWRLIRNQVPTQATCPMQSKPQTFLQATGLMWENAAAFDALLLFAEHRYYGESLPFGEARCRAS